MLNWRFPLLYSFVFRSAFWARHGWFWHYTQKFLFCFLLCKLGHMLAQSLGVKLVSFKSLDASNISMNFHTCQIPPYRVWWRSASIIMAEDQWRIQGRWRAWVVKPMLVVRKFGTCTGIEVVAVMMPIRRQKKERLSGVLSHDQRTKTNT